MFGTGAHLDYTTYISPALKEHTWGYYFMVQKVGQIPLDQILAFNTPYEYAIDLLHRLYKHVYDPLFVANKGDHWSSVLNWQSITRSSIEYLGYKFPGYILIVSDIMPTLFNLYVKGSLKTAESRETTNKS
jgi:hypothetical protein